MNTPYSHLHSFCATDMSSSLATRATLTRVLRRDLDDVFHGGEPASYLIFVTSCVIVFVLHFKWYALY
jgi:hypothetical protein